MTVLHNEKGMVKGLLGIALFVLIIAVGLQLAGPFYRSHTLQSHTRDFLKTDIGNVEIIKKHILDDAAELKVPLDQKDVEVKLADKIVKVTAKWSETVDFYGVYQKKFDFSMDEEY